jgi:hypothetical protein
MQKRLRLRLRGTQYIGQDEDLDESVPEKILMVERELFDNAVRLAQARGWRFLGRQLHCRHLVPAQLSIFAKYLSWPLDAAPSAAAPRFSTTPELTAFFSTPYNRKALDRLRQFLTTQGELTVEDA